MYKYTFETKQSTQVCCDVNSPYYMQYIILLKKKKNLADLCTLVVVVKAIVPFFFSKSFYSIVQNPFLLPFFWSAARVAVMKTSRTPSLVFAELSR